MLSKDNTDQQLLNHDILEEQIKELIADHNEVLSFTVKIGRYWIIISTVQWFFFCCRWYIWILYARKLGQHNLMILTFATYSVYFIQAFTNLFWGWIGDKYSYDVVGTVLSFLVFIGLMMESYATNYSILFIGTIIVDIFRVHQILTQSFLSQYLPNYYAIKYQSYRFALMGISNLLGPITGGIMTELFSIRYSFYFSSIVGFLSFLMFVFIINGTQKQIHLEQSKFKQLYDILKRNENINIEGDDLLNLEYQFPISTEKYINLQKQQKYILIPKLAPSQWYKLINIMFANAAMISNLAATATYFVVLCIDLYNMSVITSTAMIIVATFCYIVAIIGTPPLVLKYKNYYNISSNNFNIELYSIIICAIFMILVTSFSEYFLNLFTDNFLWFWAAINGLGIGTLDMLTEIILLNVQPKQHAGKVGGAKKFSRSVFSAFLTLLIGLLWDVNIYWFFYAQSISYSITVICTIFIMLGDRM